MRRPGKREPLPRPPIADVLVEIGARADEIPTGYGWVRMRCPFHPDRVKSAAVNHDPETGGFVCHAHPDSCPSGDALKLLQTGLGLDFKQALERAREMSPDTGNRQAKSKRTRRASDLLKGMQ